jgi:hypothetical protein
MTEPDDLSQRLAEIDHRLVELADERDRLVAERSALAAPTVPPATPFFTAPTAPTGPAYGLQTAPRQESSPQSVQNTLLTLGALLLVGAVLVFAAVTYRQLGVAGRAVILLALTGATIPVARILARRGLGASAEAVTGIGLVMGVVDAYAVRRAGWGDGLDGSTFAAVSGGVLAAFAAAWLWLEPRKAAGIGTVLFAQAPILFTSEGNGIALTILGAADVAVMLFLAYPLPAVRRTATVLGALFLTLGTARAWVDVLDRHRSATVALFIVAASLALIGLRRSGVERDVNLGLSAVLAVGGTWGALMPGASHDHRPLLLAGVAAVVMAGAWLTPARVGPTVGTLVVLGISVAAAGRPLLDGLLGPLTWLDHPWQLTPATARASLRVGESWTGDAATWLVLLFAGLGTAQAAFLLRLRDLGGAALALLVGALAILPLSLDLTFQAAVVTDFGVATSLVVAGLVVRSRLEGLALAAAGLLLGLLAAAWSIADESTTLAAVPTLAVLTAAAAVAWPGVLTGAATVLVGATVAALGAQDDLTSAAVGLLLLAVPAAAVAGSFAVRSLHREGLEGGATALGTACLVLTLDAPDRLSLTLAALGVLALILSTRPDRRWVGLGGGLLLSFSSWVRLADAGVHAPEPYVLPLAIVALCAGYLRRRSHPTMGSWEAYAAGLSLGLGPSLLKSFGDSSPTRGLLLLVVAAVVVVAGVPQRMRAPLVVGSAVLVFDLLHLLAPYANALPRWLVLATVGALLVGTGATYEQRRQDVQRLKERYDAWV